MNAAKKSNYEVNSKTVVVAKNVNSTRCMEVVAEKINHLCKETIRAIGKTLTATVLTSLIVIPIDLVGYANSTRPEFAIGGEWMMILFIFAGWLYVIDWIIGKKRKPHTTK